VRNQSPGDDKVGRMQFLLTLRRRGISDPAVLRAMDEVPREHFVDNSYVDSAYADQALPIACVFGIGVWDGGASSSNPPVCCNAPPRAFVPAAKMVQPAGSSGWIVMAFVGAATVRGSAGP